MLSRNKLAVALLAATLGAAGAARAYERELRPRSLREAFFLGKDTTFRAPQLLKDYVQTLPVPERGVHVERIEILTPFREMVLRARRAPDGYNPLKAEADYKRRPPPLAVQVTLQLTPSFPAHTPYTIPAYGLIRFRDPDFWQAFDIHVVQRGDLEPRARHGRPVYNCGLNGSCWLVGAVVTLEFDAAKVAPRPTRILVLTPDGQRVGAEFDLGRLR